MNTMVCRMISMLVMCSVLLFSGCGNIMDSYTPTDSKSKNEITASTKKISIADVADLSDEELANDFINYYNQHEEQQINIRRLVMNIKKSHKDSLDQVPFDNGLDIYINAIPLVGGFITDARVEKKKESYMDNMQKKIVNDTYFDEVVNDYLNKRIITEKTYKRFVELNKPPQIDDETYNAMIKFETILYHELDVCIEEDRTRLSSDLDIFDFSDAISYELFDSEDNKAKIKNSREAQRKVLENIQFKNFDVKNYWAAMIPLHLYPYNLYTSFQQDYDGAVDNHASKKRRLEMYDVINGSQITNGWVQILAMVQQYHSPLSPKMMAFLVRGIN